MRKIIVLAILVLCFASGICLAASQFPTMWSTNGTGLWNSNASSDTSMSSILNIMDIVPLMDAGGVSAGVDPDDIRTSANYAIVDSMGQFVTSESKSTNFKIEHGYWDSSPLKGVNGRIILRDWAGVTAGMPAVVYLKDGMDEILETKDVTLNASGGYLFTTNLADNSYTAVAKAGHWLAKAMPVSIYGGTSSVSFQLTNGDCNGDNAVDEVDYAILSFAWYQAAGDPAYNMQADLNGDGGVDEVDYAILSYAWYTAGD